MAGILSRRQGSLHPSLVILGNWPVLTTRHVDGARRTEISIWSYYVPRRLYCNILDGSGRLRNAACRSTPLQSQFQMMCLPSVFHFQPGMAASLPAHPSSVVVAECTTKCRVGGELKEDSSDSHKHTRTYIDANARRRTATSVIAFWNQIIFDMIPM